MNSKEALKGLRNIIGDDLYKRVLEEFAGTMIYFPTNPEWQDKETRNISLKEDYYSGKYEISDLAQKYNISISRVYKIIENHI
ncbi:MAG: Mor transcription activator family protein [Lachnospiraceae bacterium]